MICREGCVQYAAMSHPVFITAWRPARLVKLFLNALYKVNDDDEWCTFYCVKCMMNVSMRCRVHYAFVVRSDQEEFASASETRARQLVLTGEWLVCLESRILEYDRALLIQIQRREIKNLSVKIFLGAESWEVPMADSTGQQKDIC